MKRLFYGIATVLIFTCISLAAPEPAIVQSPNQWTLNTIFTQPQQIILSQGIDNKLIRYWYIIISVTNNTKQDVEFFPKCELVTDNFQIIPAGKGVGTLVFNLIKERHKSKYPFLELLDKTDNKLLQGEDNTKDIAIIWSDFNPNAKMINIFIAGLSNEIAVVEYPAAANDQNDLPRKIYLRKTLDLRYSIRGNPALSTDATLEYKDKSWVMR
jgi:hypothetical protein